MRWQLSPLLEKVFLIVSVCVLYLLPLTVSRLSICLSSVKIWTWSIVLFYYCIRLVTYSIVLLSVDCDRMEYSRVVHYIKGIVRNVSEKKNHKINDHWNGQFDKFCVIVILFYVDNGSFLNLFKTSKSNLDIFHRYLCSYYNSGGGDSGNSSRRPYAFLVNSSLYVWPDVVNLFDMSYSVTSQSVMDLSDRLPCLFQ